MAHEIYIGDNDVASFASTQPAWHGLGQIVSGAMTAEECIQLAHLDYEVKKMPLIAKVTAPLSPGGKEYTFDVPIPDDYCTVRMDTKAALGIVGWKYEVLQNRDAFKFFDSIVGDGMAMFETAAALGLGERIFITAKLPKCLVVTPGDVIDQYLVLTNSHDGSGSVTALYTNVRVVCNNTLRMALQNCSNKIKLKHTANIITSLDDAKNLMNITEVQGAEFLSACKAMTLVGLTDSQFRKFIELSVRTEIAGTTEDEYSTRFNNIVASILDYANSHESQQTITTKGTLYGAFNAITGFYSNVKGFKSPEEKVKSIIYGAGFRASNKAYMLANKAIYNLDFLN